MNPIPYDGFETAPVYAEPTLTADPVTRFHNLMAAEAVRKEIYDRTNQLKKDFIIEYNSEPSWVRVAFDLVHKAGTPVFTAPCSVCGLVFRVMLEWNDRVEVGNSVLDELHVNQEDVVEIEKYTKKS